MKTNKFRAWTGIKMEYNVMVGFLGAFYVQGINPNDTACMSQFNTIYSEQVPIMQFTGLHDKNGKEIYEGDIVKTIISNYEGKVEKERNGIICYNDKKACFYLEYLDERYSFKEGRNLTKESFEDFEIIGDIHSNPELLTTN